MGGYNVQEGRYTPRSGLSSISSSSSPGFLPTSGHHVVTASSMFQTQDDPRASVSFPHIETGLVYLIRLCLTFLSFVKETFTWERILFAFLIANKALIIFQKHCLFQKNTISNQKMLHYNLSHFPTRFLNFEMPVVKFPC